MGGSQAGWIMPLAASDEPRISFIVVGEGVPVTAGEENAHSAVTGDGDWDESAVAKADLALLSFHGPHGYDPAPVLEHLDIPVLWIFGLRDAVIPVTRSLGILESLIANGRTNNTVRVLPFGDHNFKNRAIGKRYDLRAVVEPWLREIGALENRADLH